MSESDSASSAPLSALELAQAAAARLASTNWSLEAEPEDQTDEAEWADPSALPNSAAEELAELPTPDAVDSEPSTSPSTSHWVHPVEAGLPGVWIPPEPVEPPQPEQIIEALLFAGGAALTFSIAARAIRGLSVETFRGAVQQLARRYRQQRRPYAVWPRDGGYVLELRPEFQAVRDRLRGGVREARLSAVALEVLSLVAYRQPITKADMDAQRGTDNGSTLRQLVRLGLISTVRQGNLSAYRTTPRFLQLFAISSLEDLPRVGEAAR
jgi:segregation and condensation protein B